MPGCQVRGIATHLHTGGPGTVTAWATREQALQQAWPLPPLARRAPYPVHQTFSTT